MWNIGKIWLRFFTRTPIIIKHQNQKLIDQIVNENVPVKEINKLIKMSQAPPPNKCYACCCPPCAVYQYENTCGVNVLLAWCLGCWFTMFCWTPQPANGQLASAGAPETEEMER